MEPMDTDAMLMAAREQRLATHEWLKTEEGRAYKEAVRVWLAEIFPECDGLQQD